MLSKQSNKQYTDTAQLLNKE